MTRDWEFWLQQRLEFTQEPIVKKGYIPGQLIFGRDIILLIKHRVYWESIRHKKHMQIDRDNTQESKNRAYYDYKLGDKLMLTNHTEYKYETPHKGSFVITYCFTNGMLHL